MDTVNADGDTNENEENQDISNAQAESTRLDHSSVMDITNVPNSQSQQSQSSCFRYYTKLYIPSTYYKHLKKGVHQSHLGRQKMG